ncbi:MAG TPA: hypothetical protein DCE18_15675 [Syntrophobacteraceae bacterium]|nr:hypothetical protein [Syntrophobacteraceae bacterium]
MSKWPQNQEYAQGWKQIAHYLGRSVRGAQDLAHVYGMPAQFVGGEVWIKYEILDKWLGTVPKWRWDDGCKSGLRKATIQCGLLLLAGVLGNLPEDLQEGIKLVAGSKERAKTLQGLAQELAKVVGES